MADPDDPQRRRAEITPTGKAAEWCVLLYQGDDISPYDVRTVAAMHDGLPWDWVTRVLREPPPPRTGGITIQIVTPDPRKRP